MTVRMFMVAWIGVAAAVAKPNVLLLCIDDLRPELASFGADYMHTPNMDGLAKSGRAFHRHYVNAPSCGPSRYTLLTGRYGPAGNNALFQRAKKAASGTVPPSMPEWFRSHGYTTVSVGKVSHHPGGLGGPDWNDPNVIEMPEAWDRNLMPVGEWEHPRGAMHGLAHGEIRQRDGQMDVYQSVPGGDTIYPDGLIADEAAKQLRALAAADKPFFLAVGLIKPHLPFGAPSDCMSYYRDQGLPPIPHPEKPEGKTTWHGSGEFMKYNRWGRDPRTDPAFADEVRRHYAACVTYADKHVGDLLKALKQTGEEDRTVIVLWGDHGWHLGEHAIWGKHALFEESLRSPLVIRYPGMQKPGEKTDAVVSTLDLFPTLCDLVDLPVPNALQGQSLVPQLKVPAVAGHPVLAYNGRARTLRNDRYRLVQHNDGFIELYDHDSPQQETFNVAAEHPRLVKELSAVLNEKLNVD